MKPPIKVSVHTNNLSKCTVRLSGEPSDDPKSPDALEVSVPSDGNVYQGLHAAREGLELAVNQILAANGIFAPEPAEPEEGEEELTSPGGDAPTATAAPKAKRAAKKTPAES